MKTFWFIVLVLLTSLFVFQLMTRDTTGEWRAPIVTVEPTPLAKALNEESLAMYPSD